MVTMTQLQERVKAGESLEQSKNNIGNAVRNLTSMLESVRNLKEKMEQDTNNTYTVDDILEAKAVYNSTLDSLQNQLANYTKL